MTTPGGLLMQRLKLLGPTRVPNGAGGYATTYAEVAQTNGQIHEVTSARGNMEELIGGQPTDLQFVDAVLDLTGVSLTGQMRVEDPDGVQYEVFRIRSSGAFARVTLRKV
jgi:hypothetical protein